MQDDMEAKGASEVPTPWLTRRRDSRALSSQQVFDRILNGPLHWPGKTVCLERNSLHEFRHRSTTANVSISELYHENSKLFPAMTSELLTFATDAEQLKQEFVRRRAAVVQARDVGAVSVAPVWRGLLRAVARSTDERLYYAVDLRVLVDGVVAFYEPTTHILQSIKELSATDLELIGAAMSPLSKPTWHCQDPLFIIVGSFARNAVLLGERGYRRTLMDAGRLAEALLNSAVRRKLHVRPVYEFCDRMLDELMEADGVEEGTLLVFETGSGLDTSVE